MRDTVEVLGTTGQMMTLTREEVKRAQAELDAAPKWQDFKAGHIVKLSPGNQFLPTTYIVVEGNSRQALVKGYGHSDDMVWAVDPRSGKVYTFMPERLVDLGAFDSSAPFYGVE